MARTSCRIQTVTPAQAKQWLQTNVGNRNLGEKVVAGYADEMRAGRWRLTNDAITFNAAGKLINGQHRLSAVVMAGKSCDFVIIEGADDAAKEVMDLGRARSVPDALKMLHGVERASMVTGAIGMIDKLVAKRQLKVTFGHAVAQLTQYRAGFEWAIGSIPGKSRFSAASIVSALVFAHATAPSGVEEFARQMFTGADLAAESPILAIRNHVLNIGGGGSTHDERKQVFLLMLTAIHRYLTRSTARRLRVNEDAIEYFSKVYEKSKSRVAA